VRRVEHHAAPKMADMVCVQNYFTRNGTKPILQVTVSPRGSLRFDTISFTGWFVAVAIVRKGKRAAFILVASNHSPYIVRLAAASSVDAPPPTHPNSESRVIKVSTHLRSPKT
jgi:hypothetical protein